MVVFLLFFKNFGINWLCEPSKSVMLRSMTVLIMVPFIEEDFP